MQNRYVHFAAEARNAPYNLEVCFPADVIKERAARLMECDTSFQVSTEVEAYARFNENVQGADPEVRLKPLDTHDILVNVRFIKEGEHSYRFEVIHEGRLYVSYTFGADFVQEMLEDEPEKRDYNIRCVERRKEYHHFEIVVEEVEDAQTARDIVQQFFDEGNDLPEDRKDQSIVYGKHTLRLENHEHIDVDDEHDFDIEE